MQINNAAPAIVFTILFALQSQALAQDPKIGSATAAKNKVEGVIQGQSEALSTGSAIFTNETVRTGETGVANLVFRDNTNLSVGPISEVHLDKFVYDPDGSSGRVVLDATTVSYTHLDVYKRQDDMLPKTRRVRVRDVEVATPLLPAAAERYKSSLVVCDP